MLICREASILSPPPGSDNLTVFQRGSARVDQARELDPERFKELRRGMEAAVAKVCPAWLRDRSDDLVQMAMMRLMAIERKSAEPRELKPAYLRKVAYSSMVDEIRRQRRRQEVPLGDDDPERPWDVMPSSDPDPEHLHASRQLGEGIRQCLARLIGPRQSAVTLYLQQHTVPEAARLLGWTPKRTENLVYRGLRDLRECLRKKGLEP